jgi:hypothetical protein
MWGAGVFLYVARPHVFSPPRWKFCPLGGLFVALHRAHLSPLPAVSVHLLAHRAPPPSPPSRTRPCGVDFAGHVSTPPSIRRRIHPVLVFLPSILPPLDSSHCPLRAGRPSDCSAARNGLVSRHVTNRKNNLVQPNRLAAAFGLYGPGSSTTAGVSLEWTSHERRAAGASCARSIG